MREQKFRMYGLVPYNISSIQQGIQYGHALQEYNNMMDTYEYNIENGSWEDKYDELSFIVSNFRKWASKDKTFIILNGGTTNNDKESEFYGTMNQHSDWLEEQGITFASFCEPDLGNQLTAIVFLVESQIYDTPSWSKFYYEKRLEETVFQGNEQHLWREEWTKLVGGENNANFKEWLSNFKLA